MIDTDEEEDEFGEDDEMWDDYCPFCGDVACDDNECLEEDDGQ